jgi:hypothetical protein
MTARAVYIEKIAYSLNILDVKYRDCPEVPEFFIDSDFDRTVGHKFLLSNHAPISLRKLIIDKITNRVVLDCILKSKIPELFVKFEVPDRTNLSKGSIPYQHFSTYDLAALRVEELVNIKRIGDYNKKWQP